MVKFEQIIVAFRQLEVYGEGAILQLFRIKNTAKPRRNCSGEALLLTT